MESSSRDGNTRHLTHLLRNLYAGQEATESDVKQWTVSKVGKEYVKAVYSHSVYLTSMQSILFKMPGWISSPGMRIAGRNINNLRYADDTILKAENKAEQRPS